MVLIGVRARIRVVQTRAMAVRRGWLVLAVLVLAVSVVGMHSLGAGHHGSTNVGHGSHEMAAGDAGQARGHVVPGSSAIDHHAADEGATSSSQDARSSSVVTTCLGCSAPGEGAWGAMCLAVVSSLLALALLLALGQLLRVRGALAMPPRWRATLVPRPPTWRTALLPVEVCVLRT